jgi:hypothetical protein
MKKYIFTIAASLLLTSAIFAQQEPADTLLRRQMQLDREFNPTLMDVQKINSLPALPQPVVQRANTNFSTWAGRTTPPLDISVPDPSTAMTEIPFDRSRGYISLNAGNYANVDGALGVRFIDNGRSMFGFNALHTSTNGHINYVQPYSDPRRNNVYVMNNFGQLRFEQLLSNLRINMHASYLHSMFNYYGNTFGSRRWFENERQHLGVFNANIGFTSRDMGRFGYRASVDLKNFNTLFGDSLVQNGVRGNEIDARLGFSQPFNATGSSRMGIDGRFFTTIYSDTIPNYSQVTVAPYITFGNWLLSARLGADAQLQFVDGNNFRVAPNVDVRLMLGEHSSLFARATGGFNPNTFLTMMNQSRYITPLAAAHTKPSFTVVDVVAGAKIGQLSGWRFDIFGGFRQTDNENFLVMDGRYEFIPDSFALPVFISRGSLMPIFGNLSHSHIGGMIKTNIWAPLTLSARVQKNFYTVKDMKVNGVTVDNALAFNKPGIETDIRVIFEATQNLRFTLNYHFAGDRWTFFNNEEVQMANINDLNIGAMYRINNSISLNLRANNVLFQRYDIWFGHPAQSFNASGGFTFRF